MLENNLCKWCGLSKSKHEGSRCREREKQLERKYREDAMCGMAAPKFWRKCNNRDCQNLVPVFKGVKIHNSCQVWYEDGCKNVRPRNPPKEEKIKKGPWKKLNRLICNGGYYEGKMCIFYEKNLENVLKDDWTPCKGCADGNKYKPVTDEAKSPYKSSLLL